MPLPRFKSELRTNRNMSFNRMTVQATADVSAIRHEEFMGRDHLVVPVVALIEGVLFPSNAPFKELALASEFGKHPDGWNGRPVTFDHPKINGSQVSANAPRILEEVGLGQLFNTKLDGKKLKTEAWIDLEKVADLSQEIQDAVARLEEGEIVEVSTGLFISLELSEGEFDGEDFGGIWREIVPDHLAILPEGIQGACSVDKGCGAPRVNSERICECQAPGISSLAEAEERVSLFEKFADKFSQFLGLTEHGLSDVDLRTALTSLLGQTTEDFIWIVAVFVKDGFMIYEQGFDGRLLKRSFQTDSDGAITLEDTTEDVRPVTTFVSLTDQEETTMSRAEQVAALIANAATQYTEEDTDFLTELPDGQFDKLEALVSNAAPSVEDSPAESSSLNTPETPADASSQEASSTENSQPTANAEGEDENTSETSEDYVAKAPTSEMREVLGASLRLHRSKKDGLIKGIRSNSRNHFSEEELSAMDLKGLENIASLANVLTDYSGATPALRDNTEEENVAPSAPLIFPVKAANG